MTSRQRQWIHEALAITVAGIFGLFAVPTLISAHDSVALLCAVVLLGGWVGWVTYFVYRINREYFK
jgi:hypothetical protein